MRRGFTEPAVGFVDGVAAAVGRLHGGDEVAHFGMGLRGLGPASRRERGMPQAHQRMRHEEVVVHLGGYGGEHVVERFGADQRTGEAVDFFREGVVFLAELQEIREPGLENAVLFPQGQYLPLADGDGAPAVRVGDGHIGEQGDVLLEEFGVMR